MTASSLLLSFPDWDLVLTQGGNVAVVADAFDDPLEAEGYARAQDAACAIREFLGENWYDTSQGVPYWQQILGKVPSIQTMKAQFIKAALTVDGVASAQVFISSVAGRVVNGQVQIITVDGQAAASNF